MVGASSTLVNVSDDAEVRLVALLAETAPPNLLSPTFQADCQNAIDAGQAGPLLDTILNDAGALASLLSIEPNDEAAAAFSLVAALSDRAGRPVEDLADVIVNAAQQLPNKQERKITFLSVLYNMRSDTREKLVLLRRMMELANADMLAPEETLGRLLTDTSYSVSRPGSTYQPQLVSMLDSWQVVVDDAGRRDLYQTIASVLPPGDIRKQRFLLLLVDSYTSSSSNAIGDQAVEAARDATVGAIRDPVSLFVHQRSMLTLPAIQAMGRKYPTLLGLLQVFQEGKLSDYQAFVQSNGGENAVLSPWGLEPESCARNMRILSLCSLASEYEEIAYSVVAETLQLPSDNDVEKWVIAAVSSGLLEAKMDQLQFKVMVERSVVRRFEMDQWKALQSRLRLWKQNVGGVLDSLKESQLGAAPH